MTDNLQIPSFADANILEESVLAADVAVAATTAELLNVQNVPDNSYLAFDPASETAELRQVTDLTGNVVTVAAFGLAHVKRSRVVRLFGDKVKIYRAANVNGYAPADASFSSIATEDIDIDQEMTSYTDSSGGSDYWYKFTYYNSTSTDETALSQSPAVRGGGSGHYVSVEEIRKEAGISQVASLGDTMIAVRRSQAENLADGSCASAGYTMPLQDAGGNEYVPEIVVLATTLIAAGYVLAKDFGAAAGEAGEKAADDGRSKVKAGMKILSDIVGNKILLLDSNKQPLTRTTQVAGYPDNGTADLGADGVTPQPFQMSITKVF